MGDRPIFVIGAQRSGTTLLQAMLGAHRHIAAPPEMHFIFRIQGLSDYFGDLNDDANLRRTLHEALNPVVPMLENCGFDEDRLFQAARRGSRTYAGLLDAIMGDFAARQGKRRWSEKTPDQLADAVLFLFPEAQLIHIVRDPRDMVASARETPWEQRDVVRLAEFWRRFTLRNIATGRRVGPAQFHQVRYEDLVADPEAVLRVVCAFLDEPYEPEMVEQPDRRVATVARVATPWHGRALEPVTASRQGRHAVSLGRIERLAITAVVRRELAVLGYGTPSRRAVAAGTVARIAWWPRRLPDALRQVRQRRQLRSPEARYLAVHRFIETVGRRVQGVAVGPRA